MKSRVKLLTYILTMSLSAATLGGCGRINFTYSTDENGKIAVENTIDYDTLANYKLVEIKLLNNQNRLYIAKKVYAGNVYNKHYAYDDIFTNQRIYDVNNEDSNMEIINEYSFGDFLILYEEIQPKYTIEDIERIYNKIVENYEFATDKVLKK